MGEFSGHFVHLRSVLEFVVPVLSITLAATYGALAALYLWRKTTDEQHSKDLAAFLSELHKKFYRKVASTAGKR